VTKLTNNSLGPKFIPTTGGPVILQPGQSADLDVPEDDLTAIKAVGLLDAPKPGQGAPSLADLQREIASTSVAPPPGQPSEGAQDTDASLPAADDPDVVALVDGNTAVQLQELAETNKVDMAGATNKTEAAQRIVAAQRAQQQP
jgi:hypothetical protein